MSYSFHATASGGVITEWVEQPQHGYAEIQSKDDIDLAHDLAARMAATLGGECTIEGGGHANPLRKPGDGWASDYMRITAMRQQPPIPAPVTEPDVESAPLEVDPAIAEDEAKIVELEAKLEAVRAELAVRLALAHPEVPAAPVVAKAPIEWRTPTIPSEPVVDAEPPPEPVVEAPVADVESDPEPKKTPAKKAHATHKRATNKA